MPPPNANDPLHVGHAMFVSIEDILTRHHRMLGEAALWLPGTDHAGIETQYVFEKKLAREGKSRFQFDRETLYKLIWDYVQENSGVSIDQMKQLGASADWDRYKFTLDPEIVDQVLTTFEKMDQDQLIYRSERLVNYCVRCGTAFSELEVKYETRNDPLYYMKYGPFTLATVRPETKFGDTAVAVNPKDER
jgi:valyl-tRNA synthetase